jgi:hypothetical protein
MKKKILFCFILFLNSFLFSVTESTNNVSETKINEDLDSLKTYLTQCWVGYDEAVQKGFNIDRCIRKIKTDYKRINFKHKHQKKDDVYNNGINNTAMTSAIIRNLSKYLPEENKDEHFYITGEINNGSIYPRLYQFYTNIFLEYLDGKYIVCKSDIKEIPIGSVYTGNLENVLPWIQEGKQIYRVGIKQKYYSETTKLNFNGKDIKVEITYIYNFNQIENHIGYLDTDNSIYVSLSDCRLASEDKDKHEKLENEFEEVLNKISNNNYKKYLILDLRGNGGWFPNYPTEILSSYFYGNDKIKARNFNNFLKVFDYGSITLDSLEIAKKQYEFALENKGFPDIWVNSAFEHYQELLKTPKRVYNGLEFLPMGQLPQIKTKDYNGKVIILMDIQTGSAAEYGIALSYFEDKDSVILIGDKTSGRVDFGGVYDYVLPNSKVIISLSTIDFRKIAGLAHNSHWHGDTLGFYPDYYATDENILDTIVYVTQDKELTHVLNGIEKQLLP